MTDQANPPASVDVQIVRTEPAGLPALVRAAGGAAQFAFEEFFHGQIRNPFTRKAYLHSWRQFSDWCLQRRIDLVRVTPADVGRFLDSLPVSLPTRKLHLAALRRFFDGLVLRHVLILNPALSVWSERYQVLEGKTLEIAVPEARRLQQCIDRSQVVGLRDYAVIGILIYTAARVGAVAKLRCRDFYQCGGQSYLRFHEKGGKVREIPVRHDLERAINDYLDQSELRGAPPASPLFRTTLGRTKRFTERAFSADDMGRMMKRRLRDAGLSSRLSPHSFRVMTVTDLLDQGVPLEDVQYLAGHADPRTTRLYDRRQRRVDVATLQSDIVVNTIREGTRPVLVGMTGCCSPRWTARHSPGSAQVRSTQDPDRLRGGSDGQRCRGRMTASRFPQFLRVLGGLNSDMSSSEDEDLEVAIPGASGGQRHNTNPFRDCLSFACRVGSTSEILSVGPPRG